MAREMTSKDTPQAPPDAELETILNNVFSIGVVNADPGATLNDDAPIKNMEDARKALFAWRDHTQAQVTDLAAADSGAALSVSNPTIKPLIGQDPKNPAPSSGEGGLPPFRRKDNMVLYTDTVG